MDYENTIQLIDELTTRLQVPADLLHETLLRQARIDMVYCGLLILGLLGLMITMFRSLKNPPDWLDGDVNIVVCILGIILCAAVSIILTGVFITAALNPEYYAFKELISAVK